MGVAKARLNASSRRYALSFSDKILGRSVRLFRLVSVAPDIETPKYLPVGKCIYCDSTLFDRPGVRNIPSGRSTL